MLDSSVKDRIDGRSSTVIPLFNSFRLQLASDRYSSHEVLLSQIRQEAKTGHILRRGAGKYHLRLAYFLLQNFSYLWPR